MEPVFKIDEEVVVEFEPGVQYSGKIIDYLHTHRMNEVIITYAVRVDCLHLKKQNLKHHLIPFILGPAGEGWCRRKYGETV